MAGELAQDVALDAVVDGDDVEFGAVSLPETFAETPRRLVPGEALRRGHGRNEVHADQAGPFAGLALERVEIETARGLVGDHRVGHAVLPDQRGQRAGVDAGEPDDAAALEPFVEMARGAVVRWLGDGGMQHTPRAPGVAARLTVSMSSSLVPTLPICGNVKVMICPA